MSDYSATCPWSFLAEMVEGGSFPKELLDKLQGELLASNTALQIVKDENEVNKKNMFKFMKQNKELTEAYTKLLKRRNWDASERKKLREQIKKLEEEIKNLKEEIDDALDAIDNSFIQATDQERFELFREDLLV